MAGSEGGRFCHAPSTNMERLVIDNEEFWAHPICGCSKCSSTGEPRPWYEVSMKERLQGINRRYPLSHYDDHNSCPHDYSHAVHSLNKLTMKLKVSKDSDRPARDSDRINTTKPDTKELERVIKATESHLSSLKAKLQNYKEQEGTLSHVPQVRDEVRPENSELVGSGDETEGSCGEIAAVMSEWSDEAATVRGESGVATSDQRNRSDIQGKVVMGESGEARSELRNRLVIQGETKSYNLPKVRRDKPFTRDQEAELSESEHVLGGIESESIGATLNKSLHEELYAGKITSRHKHGGQMQRQEHSPGKGFSSISDSDASYGELEIHSDMHGTSNVTGRIIKIRKQPCDDDDASERSISQDAEDQQPAAKRRCLDFEEEYSESLTPSIFDEADPTDGSQRSVESEATESSIYLTAKEASFQASETLLDSLEI